MTLAGLDGLGRRGRGLDHVGPTLTQPTSIKDGHAVLDECPGSRVEWDEERMAGLVTLTRICG
jgi:hypothetical protein